MDKPVIVTMDMGLFKPLKYAIWFPWPVWKGKDGRLYHIHPRRLFKTEKMAENFIRKESIK